MSGHGLAHASITRPANRMSTFAATSLRAASHAPRVSAPPRRSRTSSMAHTRLMSIATTAVPDKARGSGTAPVIIFHMAVLSDATAGTRISPANT